MHLSLLSDSFFSDAVQDEAKPSPAWGCDSDTHFPALVRGVLFGTVLMTPLALWIISGWLDRGVAADASAANNVSAAAASSAQN